MAHSSRHRQIYILFFQFRLPFSDCRTFHKSLSKVVKILQREEFCLLFFVCEEKGEIFCVFQIAVPTAKFFFISYLLIRWISTNRLCFVASALVWRWSKHFSNSIHQITFDKYLVIGKYMKNIKTFPYKTQKPEVKDKIFKTSNIISRKYLNLWIELFSSHTPIIISVQNYVSRKLFLSFPPVESRFKRWWKHDDTSCELS